MCLIIILLVLNIKNGLAQNVPVNAQPNDKEWHMGGNQATNTTPPSTVFGTLFNQSIFIRTNGKPTSQFSVGNSLGANMGLGPGGDGLKILGTSLPGADLDLWTDGTGIGNGTHIRWDGSGVIL